MHPFSKTFVGLHAAHHSRNCFHGRLRYPFHLAHGRWKKASVAADSGPPTSDVSSAGGKPSMSKGHSASSPLASAHEQVQTWIHAWPLRQFAAHPSSLRSICTMVSSTNATLTSAHERVSYPDASLALRQFATHLSFQAQVVMRGRIGQRTICIST